MNKRLKTLSIMTSLMVLLNFAGCGGDGTVKPQQNSENEVSQNKTVSSKEEYAKYIDEKAKLYFSDLKVDTAYDFNKIDQATIDVSDDYVNGMKTSYNDLEERLQSFKTDLETNVKTNDKEVKKLNDKMIASIDKNLDEIKKANSSLSDNSKDLLSKSKDDFVSAMKKIGEAPSKARNELYDMIKDTRNTLGIK